MSRRTPDINRPKGSSLVPLRALASFIRPYLGTLFLALGALFVASGAFLALPVAVRYVIDFGFSAADAATIDRYFIFFLGIALLFGFFGAARTYFINLLGERVVADLRNAVYRHVIRMDLTFFEITKTGEVLSRLTADTTLIQSISGVGLSIILRSSIQLGGALALLAITNARLMGYILLLLPAVLVPILAVGRWVRSLSRDSRARIAEASGLAGETLNAVQTVQAFTAEELVSRRFGAMVAASFETALRRIKARALFSIAATTGLFAALIVVLWIGARAVLGGEMTGGELGQFVLYSIFVAISAAGAFRTDDAGKSGKPINRGLKSEYIPDPEAEIGHCVHRLALHQSQPEVLFMQKHWDVMRSDDAGENWHEISGNLPSDFGFVIDVHAHEPETIYVLPIKSDSEHFPPEGKLRVYRSRIGGNEWEALTRGLPQKDCFVDVLRDAMSIDTLDPCGVYFGTTGGQVYASSAEGDSWSSIVRDLPKVLSVEVQTLT